MTNEAPDFASPAPAPASDAGHAGANPVGTKTGSEASSRIPRNKLLSHRKFPNGSLLSARSTDSARVLAGGSAAAKSHDQGGAEHPSDPRPQANGSNCSSGAEDQALEAEAEGSARSCSNAGNAFAKAFATQNGRVAEGESGSRAAEDRTGLDRIRAAAPARTGAVKIFGHERCSRRQGPRRGVPPGRVARPEPVGHPSTKRAQVARR